MTLSVRLRSVHVSNATYGIAEYISLPILMLCSAPFLLHRLGVEQYAIWLLASAAVTGGMLLSAGFGDAAVKYISACRGRNRQTGVERIIRTLFAINLTLGTAVAALLWLFTPLLVAHLPHVTADLRVSYQRALSIGCVLLLVRVVESVFLCTQRAYERFDIAARFTVAARIAIIGSAVVIAATGRGTVTIMVVTLLVSLLSLAAQMVILWRGLALRSLLPSWDRATIKELFSFGCFSWLQGIVGLLTGQADRFLVGYLLGTHALTYYSISVQAAAPIHGIASAGLQIIFPYIAARLGILSVAAMRRKFAAAFAANVAVVALLAAPVIFGSHPILRLWLGEDFAAHATTALTVTACAFALVGLNVTGSYVLMGVGRMKVLALTNLGGAAVMLAAIAVLAPRFGIVGAASGRIVYGLVALLIYRPLHNALRTAQAGAGKASAMLEAL
ncbi:MAG TPA: oligosaccharide flippase family protein [Acidobacteriaceae bacterium]|nr:oligosaccharide flippase family protein [Acidobacteriaceae bacterium]